MGFGAADLFAWRRYVSGWEHMPEGCGGDNKNAGRSACSVSSPIGLNRMYHKNAGAKERNKQHRARPLKLTARWWVTVSASAFQDDFVASRKCFLSPFWKRLWWLRHIWPLAALSRGAALCTSVAKLQHGG
jgi:hypothetical protein